jgi:N-methylhydantoinase A
MLIGIDVGGTYTDAVVIKDNKIINTSKTPTKHDNLVESLILALDEVIHGISPQEIRQVTFSTTLITNIIAENKYEPVAAIIIPGPGVNPNLYKTPGHTWVVRGAIDYRGREIAPLVIDEVNDVIDEILQRGYENIAIVGKFAQRNSAHEKQIAKLIQDKKKETKVDLGYQLSGKINFPRRINTTIFNAATKSLYLDFVQAVTNALNNRKIEAPVYILKADGGTLPIKQSIKQPVETIFSGPAASTLGVIALSPKGETSVVVDIGGTTTDLALILEGEPLLSSKGAQILEFNTQVRSFAVKAVAIGGDSAVRINKGLLEIGPDRLGPAYCLGGPVPTPTDALRVVGLTEHGDFNKAREAMISVAQDLGNIPPEVAASKILEKVTQKIMAEINAMFFQWQSEPAYRVWEIIQRKKLRPKLIAGVGGAAAGIVPLVAKGLKCKPLIPKYSEVANAIGAAVAQPTFTVTIHADTEAGTYRILEEGFQGSCQMHFNRDVALEIINKWFTVRKDKLGIKDLLREPELIRDEVFNMIRGFSLTGKIFDIAIQTPWSIAGYIDEGEKS